MLKVFHFLTALVTDGDSSKYLEVHSAMLFKRGRFLTEHVARAVAPQPRLKHARRRNRRSADDRRQGHACLVEQLEDRLLLSGTGTTGTTGGAGSVSAGITVGGGGTGGGATANALQIFRNTA